MFTQNPLPFIETYVEGLEEELGKLRPQRKLSRVQKRWLKYCLMGILLTKFSRSQRLVGKQSFYNRHYQAELGNEQTAFFESLYASDFILSQISQ